MKKHHQDVMLLNLPQAAEILNVSRKTLHRMIRAKELPAFKVGGQWRMREITLRKWIEGLENGQIESC